MRDIIRCILFLIYISCLLYGNCFGEPQPVHATDDGRLMHGEHSPFGMHSAYARPYMTDGIPPQEALRLIIQAEAPYRYARDIKIKWMRLTSDIYWTKVQPTKTHVDRGQYDWRFYDAMIGRAPRGVRILGTICVGTGRTKPSSWAFLNPDVENHYLEFVRQVVERYDGDGIADMPFLKNPITHWQIENEPAVYYEIKIDWQGFSRLFEQTYRIIKANDPAAKIALGGLAGGNAFNNLADPYHYLMMAQLNDFYFPLVKHLGDAGISLDIFDIHFYSGDLSRWPQEWNDNWPDMKDIYTVIRNNLNASGHEDTDIWITETATTERINGERAQASGLIKRYVYALSLGVRKIFWWNMVEGEHPLSADKPANHFGLVYDGIGFDDPGYGSKKLAYFSYKKLVDTLSGSDWHTIETIHEADGIFICRFRKRGKQIWVAWSAATEEIRFPIQDIHSRKVRLTSGVPSGQRGVDIGDDDAVFPSAIVPVRHSKVEVTLEPTPVFIEEI